MTSGFVTNSKTVLGEHLPSGGKRLFANVLLAVAFCIMAPAAAWKAWLTNLTIGDLGVLVLNVSRRLGVHCLARRDRLGGHIRTSSVGRGVTGSSRPLSVGVALGLSCGVAGGVARSGGARAPAPGAGISNITPQCD